MTLKIEGGDDNYGEREKGDNSGGRSGRVEGCGDRRKLGLRSDSVLSLYYCSMRVGS